MLEKISLDTFMKETSRSKCRHYSSTYEEVFYKHDPFYTLYEVSMERCKMNGYYIYLYNGMLYNCKKEEKTCYKTDNRQVALQLANNFYEKIQKTLNYYK